MLLLDAGSAPSDMSPIDRIRFIRAELADDVAISAVISMVIAETWRHIMITTQWLENLVERNKATYDEKIRAEGRTEVLAEVLALLDEDTRKDVERKLRRNGDSE